jgi:predicted DNA-binding protein YlxM (UPF0122 family)
VQKREANRLSILYWRLVGEKVQVIATKLGVSEQAVYKNIKSGGLGAVIQTLSGITDIMNESLVS